MRINKESDKKERILFKLNKKELKFEISIQLACLFIDKTHTHTYLRMF